MPKLAALYARISKADDNVPKVENQLADLERLAAARGLTIVDRYVDDGLSAAKAENRPDFDRLLADLASGKFTVILATEEARLARNETEKFALMFTCSQAGATWETLRDGHVDPSTAAGALMAGIRGSIDAFESRRRAERQRQANIHKREKGLPGAGKRPFGFKEDKITPEPDEADLIKRGTEMALSGARKFEVLELFRESGIKTARGGEWHAASMVALLRRWRNAGYVEHDDEPYGPAVWPPIIADDRERALQMVRDVRTIYSTPKMPGQWQKPTHLASGIAKCGFCDRQMVFSGGTRVPGYRCIALVTDGKGNGAGHASIRASILDAVIVKELLKLYLWQPEQLTDDTGSEAELGQLHSSLGEVQKKLERLLDLYTEGDLSRAEYNKRVAPLKIQEEDIQQAIADFAKSNAHTAMLIEAQQTLMQNWAERGITVTPDPRGTNERSRMIRPPTKPGETVSAKDALGIIREYREVGDQLREAFEALSLTDQRRLVSASLNIVVQPGGRGAKRVLISSRLNSTEGIEDGSEDSSDDD